MWNILLESTGMCEWIIRTFKEAGVSEKENEAEKEREPNEDIFWAGLSTTGYQMQLITHSRRAAF